MKNKKKVLLCIFVLMLGCVSQVCAQTNWLKKGTDFLAKVDDDAIAETPSVGDMSAAFKQALSMGSEKVVSSVGAADGFNSDPAIRVPLPQELATVKKMLIQMGMSGMVDDLELKLNRAAEAAAPMAKDVFVRAISDMTFEDVMAIYNGADDAATQYFQEKMAASLSEAMRPIVDKSLSEVGAIAAYDTVMGKYQALPFVPNVKANITDHVIEKGMAGIFYYLAKEEAAIRHNPMKQTTELLKKVFGA